MIIVAKESHAFLREMHTSFLTVMHKQMWPHKCLTPTTVKLRTYSGNSLVVKVSMMAQVHYNNKEDKLSL